MSALIETSRGRMSAEQIIDELTYSNYAFNRGRGCTAEALGKYFANGAALEARYQTELHGGEAA